MRNTKFSRQGIKDSVNDEDKLLAIRFLTSPSVEEGQKLVKEYARKSELWQSFISGLIAVLPEKSTTTKMISKATGYGKVTVIKWGNKEGGVHLGPILALSEPIANEILNNPHVIEFIRGLPKDIDPSLKPEDRMQKILDALPKRNANAPAAAAGLRARSNIIKGAAKGQPFTITDAEESDLARIVKEGGRAVPVTWQETYEEELAKAAANRDAKTVIPR